MTGRELRSAIRAGRWAAPTAGAAAGFVQANMVALPAAEAEAFEAFCRANSRACPLLEVTPPGDPRPLIALGADLRTDLPRYRVYRYGELVGERAEVADLWAADTVGFLLGCSFTAEHALMTAGIPLRHVAQGRNVAMYRTTIECESAPPFKGRLVVSMRPISRGDLDDVVAICAELPEAHGEPIAAGSPERLGIRDLGCPDFGDPIEIGAGEVPVFWACGVTASEAACGAGPPLVITHAPGYMFVTDRRVDAAAVPSETRL